MNRKSILPRTVAISATALLASTTALIAGAVEPAGGKVDPAVPAECGVTTRAYDAKGTYFSYSYGSDGAELERIRRLSLPFQPEAWTNIGAAGDSGFPAFFRSTDLAIDDGTLYVVTNEGQQVTERKWDYTVEVAAGQDGLDDIRAITTSYPYLYALTVQGSLERYSYDYDGGLTPAGTIAASGFESVQNISVDRSMTNGTGDDGPADVLLATDSATGALIEITVPHDEPGDYAQATLLDSGFVDVTSLSSGWCIEGGQSTGGQPLLAITSAGHGFVYYDADHADGSGADITGGSTVLAKNWKARGFSQ